MTLSTKSHIFGTFRSHKFVTHLRTESIEVKQLKMTGKGYLNSILFHKICSYFSANIDIVLCQISAENSFKLQMSNFENRLASMLQIRKGTFISERVISSIQRVQQTSCCRISITNFSCLIHYICVSFTSATIMHKYPPTLQLLLDN